MMKTLATIAVFAPLCFGQHQPLELSIPGVSSTFARRMGPDTDRDLNQRITHFKKTLCECESKSPALFACVKAFLGDGNALFETNSLSSDDFLNILTLHNITRDKEDVPKLLEKFYTSQEFKAQSKGPKESYDMIQYYNKLCYPPFCGRLAPLPPNYLAGAAP